MYIRAPKEAYKGQEIEVVCDSSLFLFSHGTQITWSVEGDSFPRGFASGQFILHIFQEDFNFKK